MIEKSQILETTVLDLERLREEFLKLREEKQLQGRSIEELQYRLLEQENQASEDIKSLENQIKSQEELLEKDQKHIHALQLELMKRSHEVVSLKEESEKEKESHHNSIRIHEETINKLQRQGTVKSATVSSQEELENRLQTITEHLIQKQNQLENVMSEKQYLQLQLENVLQNQKSSDEKHTIVIEDHSSKRRDKPDAFHGVRLRSLASVVESSSSHPDSPLTRKVMGAANFIDSVSTATGKYLSHYPLVRLSAIFYMCLLHMWVFYVFCTFNPEVHPD